MIDLDKIIEENDDGHWIRGGMLQDDVKDCMKEAIRQALKLASEEAKVVEHFDIEKWNYRVSKQSIMNVMDKIK